MLKTDLPEEQYAKLLSKIFSILVEKGPSQTTTDLVARQLGMSKRTLYEIFENKDAMLKSALDYAQKRNTEIVEEILRTSENIMEALVNILLYQQKIMANICADFFVDMDGRYKHLRGEYETSSSKWNCHLNQALALGKRQGVFREDLNSELFVPIMRVQMESLKRMEEFFPPGITLMQAYNAICLNMLRGIATERGMQILDKLSPKFK